MSNKEFFKPKNILLKLEEVTDPQEKWAFTINPEEQFFMETDIDREARIRAYVQNYILKTPNIRYTLNVELSPTGRLHGHGYIKFVNYRAFLMNDVHRILDKCTIVIKRLFDLIDSNVQVVENEHECYNDTHTVWEEYINKQAAHQLGKWQSFTVISNNKEFF